MNELLILIGCTACIFFGVWMWVAAIESAIKTIADGMTVLYSLIGTVLIVSALVGIVRVVIATTSYFPS